MQATARMASVVSSTLPARRRLIRSVRPRNRARFIMMTNQPANITRIPTAAFLVAPLLYGGGLGLHVLFPLFGDRYLLQPLMVVLPCILVLSFIAVGVRLLAAPPRTWGLILSLVINLSVSAFALWMTWLTMMFPTPD